MNHFSKAYYLFLLTLITISCGGNSPGEVENDQKNAEEEEIAIESFYGEWYLAVKRPDGWYEIAGCDNYGPKINPSDNGSEGVITVTDRIGLSVDVYANIVGHSGKKDGSFVLEMHDLQSDKNYPFSGKYYEIHPDWNCTVIDVDKNSFFEMLTYDIDGGFSELRMFKDNISDAFLAGVDEIDCDFGFDDDYEDMVPEGGLTSENMTEELAATLVLSFGGEILEGSLVSFVDYGNYFMLIHDYQFGDYTDMTFYSVDRLGNKIHEYKMSAVFDWNEDQKKYKVDENNRIFCQPGDWKHNEQKDRMDLITTDCWLWINDLGEIQIKK